MSVHFESPQTLGSRNDPHAQARAARQQPLLLHSLSLFREIFEIIFAHRKVGTVVEVGVESGQVSSLYAELGARIVYGIEPTPTPELRATFDEHEALLLVEATSPEALGRLPVADLYVLDGDHNYATVRREVNWILAHAPDAIIAFHDVLWPSSRRDQYYEPSGLAINDRFPSTDNGPTVWHDEVTPAGFVGRGSFTCSVQAGGERNGVLTALEDALAESPDHHLELIPAVFGLGIVLRPTSESDGELARNLHSYSHSQLLAAMENNRIALYTRVLELQADAVARANDADELVRTIGHKQAEIAKLRHETDTIKDRHTEHVQQLHQENNRLTRELDEQGRFKNIVRNLAKISISSLQKLTTTRR